MKIKGAILRGLEIFAMLVGCVLLEVFLPHTPAKSFLILQFVFAYGINTMEGGIHNTGAIDRILSVFAGYFLAYAVVGMNFFQ